MEKQQQSMSNAPMILVIIGGVLGLPGAICSGACVAGLGALADAGDAEVSSAADFYMWMAVIGALLGLLSAFLYKKSPKLWGSMMIVAAFMSGITLITFNMLSLIVCILFLIAGLIALAQKKEHSEIN